jgi:hypothetical protein
MMTTFNSLQGKTEAVSNSREPSLRDKTTWRERVQLSQRLSKLFDLMYGDYIEMEYWSRQSPEALRSRSDKSTKT